MTKKGWVETAKEKTQTSINEWVQGKPLPKALLHWHAPEFYFVNKSMVWGIVVAVIFIAVAALLVYFGQILAAVASLLFMVVTLKFAYAKPEKIDYRIEEDGIRVSGWLHPYWEELVGFWIARQNKKPVLYLEVRNPFVDYMALPLGDTSIKKTTRVLGKFIPEAIPPSTPKVPSTRKKEENREHHH